MMHRTTKWQRLLLTAFVMVLFIAPLEVTAFDPLARLEGQAIAYSTLQATIKERFESHKNGLFGDAKDWWRLKKFYEKRDYLPLWISRSRPKKITRRLIERLSRSTNEILRHTDLRTYEEHLKNGDADDEQQAWFELMMSEGMMIYARGLAIGQYDPAKVDKDWLIKRRYFNFNAFLPKLAESDDADKLLDGLEPKSEEYHRLKQALQHYRNIAERGGWEPLPSNMPLLKPGMDSQWVPALRRRLLAEQNFSTIERESSTLFDRDLAKAVRTFQRRNGLKVDGVVGRNTRRVLDIPIQKRIQSIVASLDRWRWLPRTLGGRYILVNLPAFSLQLVDHGRVTWETRVITGRKRRPSPSIASNITQLKVNPKWHVPDKIALKDLIPKQQRNPEFLTKNGYRVFVRGTDEEVDPVYVDWSDIVSESSFPYLIRQESGDRNALGRLKFEMPSRHAIYLHDTPAKRLFNKTERMFSSGCIRVQSPYELAGMLLNNGDPEKGRWAVLREIDRGVTRDIQLPSEIPVYLTYFTAWVDKDGITHFRRDVYGRDHLFTDDGQLTN